MIVENKEKLKEMVGLFYDLIREISSDNYTKDEEELLPVMKSFHLGLIAAQDIIEDGNTDIIDSLLKKRRDSDVGAINPFSNN